MISKITVAEIVLGKRGTNQKGNWQQVTVIDSDGTKYSSFDPLALTLKPGTVIEIEWEKKENFNNMVTYHVTGETSALPAKVEPPKVETPKIETSKGTDLRNRAFALSYAKDLAVAGKIDIAQMLPQAVIFDNWLQGK